MKIFAVYSSKGGETARAVNLSYCAAWQGYRVLLCDIDAHGAASYHELPGGSFDTYIHASDYVNPDLLPAHFSFLNPDLAQPI